MPKINSYPIYKKNWQTKLILFIGLLWSSTTFAINAELDIIGRIPAGEGYAGAGSQGLYLGNGSYWTASWYNFEWDENVSMVIEDNGSASISGQMTHLSDDDVWDFEINLGDLRLEGDFSGGQSTAYAGMVDDLIAEGQAGDASGDGIVWDTLSMTLDSRGSGHYWIDETDWVGKQLGAGNPEVAVLDWNPNFNGGLGGLDLGMWMQHFDPSSSSWWAAGLGDTKATAIYSPQPVPEPSTCLLVIFGLIGLGIAKKRGMMAKKN